MLFARLMLPCRKAMPIAPTLRLNPSAQSKLSRYDPQHCPSAGVALEGNFPVIVILLKTCKVAARCRYPHQANRPSQERANYLLPMHELHFLRPQTNGSHAS